MAKKLPSVFSNKIDKTLNNNERFYVSSISYNKPIYSKEEIKDKINKIFKSSSYVYKANVEITLKDKVVNKKIIALKDDKLLDINGEYINLDDILDIKIKD